MVSACKVGTVRAKTRRATMEKERLRRIIQGINVVIDEEKSLKRGREVLGKGTNKGHEWEVETRKVPWGALTSCMVIIG